VHSLNDPESASARDEVSDLGEARQVLNFARTRKVKQHLRLRIVHSRQVPSPSRTKRSRRTATEGVCAYSGRGIPFVPVVPTPAGITGTAVNGDLRATTALPGKYGAWHEERLPLDSRSELPISGC
jgi:hypothetical protein